MDEWEWNFFPVFPFPLPDCPGDRPRRHLRTRAGRNVDEMTLLPKEENGVTGITKARSVELVSGQGSCRSRALAMVVITGGTSLPRMLGRRAGLAS